MQRVCATLWGSALFPKMMPRRCQIKLYLYLDFTYIHSLHIFIFYCIYIHILIHLCIHEYIYIYVCMYICIYVHKHTHVQCIYTHMYRYMKKYPGCEGTCMHTCIYAYVYICTYVQIYMYIKYTYVYIHEEIPWLLRRHCLSTVDSPKWPTIGFARNRRHTAHTKKENGRKRAGGTFLINILNLDAI